VSAAGRLEALAARCLVLGFDGLELTEDARRLVAAGAGGVILFRRNVDSAEQVRALTDAVRAAAPGAVILSVDQEGGRVARLRGIATDLPPMRVIGGHDAGTAEAVGRLLGTELFALGFDLDMAPVVDVDTNPDNPVIGDRAFSSDPERVADLAAAFIRGLQAAGVGACAKHFPGHGDTEVDSHFGLPRVQHDRARLDAVELMPFRALARSDLASVMTAHVVVEAIDPGLPATMSPKVLAILREEMGFEGAVLSDDLEMAAIADGWDLGEAAVAAIGAGCDQVLVCHRADRQQAVIEALASAVSSGRLPEARLREAADRVDALASRFPPGRPRPQPADMLRLPEHRALASRLIEGAARLGVDPTGDR
jgi:beta-N-acetylhexosaminidase